MKIHAFIGPDSDATYREIRKFVGDSFHYHDAFFSVYPSKVKDVVQELRDRVSDYTAVIQTHNPLVINELEPHEVTLVTIHDGVVRKTLMHDTKNFKQRASVYALGELWLSFCTGKLDEPDLTGGEDLGVE